MKLIYIICAIIGLNGHLIEQSNEMEVERIEIYSLPKHLKSKFRISVSDIKTHEGATKKIIKSNKRLVDYLSQEASFIGEAKPEFKDLDVRFLIEILYTDGHTNVFSFSSTNLVQVNSKTVFVLKDYKGLMKRVKQYVPKKYEW